MTSPTVPDVMQHVVLVQALDGAGSWCGRQRQVGDNQGGVFDAGTINIQYES